MLQFLAPVVGLLGGKKAKLGLIVIVIAGTLGGGGYLYINHMQKEVARLEADAQTLKMNEERARNALESTEDALTRTSEQFAELAKKTQELEKQNREARAYQEELIGLLTRHDLEYLAYEKPGLIERRINDATSKVFASIESITTPE